jgi:hypothetical protein
MARFDDDTRPGSALALSGSEAFMRGSRNRWATILYLGLLALVSLSGAAADATIVVRLPGEVMVARADVIVLGQVEATQARWEGQRIITSVLVRVENALKGQPGTTVMIKAPGGKVGNVAMKVLAAPKFQVGERALLFLKNGQGNLHVLGLADGKLDVRAERLVWNEKLQPLPTVIDEIRRRVRGEQ